jgi:hypothetical protein
MFLLRSLCSIGTGLGLSGQQINWLNDQTKAKFDFPGSVEPHSCAWHALLNCDTGTWILVKLTYLPVLAGKLDVTVRISATKGITCFWRWEKSVLYGWQGFEPRVVRSLWLRTCANLAGVTDWGWGCRPCPGICLATEENIRKLHLVYVKLLGTVPSVKFTAFYWQPRLDCWFLVTFG